MLVGTNALFQGGSGEGEVIGVVHSFRLKSGDEWWGTKSRCK